MTDDLARHRIETQLDGNLLVEAGAGSGKTTSLVRRIAALIADGKQFENIAAVTFTRKAATELRERLQDEFTRRASQPDALNRENFRGALEQFHLGFIGTIHSFCARILHEHAIMAGLPPDFVELDEMSTKSETEAFWRRWTEAELQSGSPLIARLLEAGISLEELGESFRDVIGYPDVFWETAVRPLPDSGAALARLLELLQRTEPLLPSSVPPGGWDELQRTMRSLRFRHRTGELGSVVGAMAALEALTESAVKVTQNRWSTEKTVKRLVAELGREWQELAIDLQEGIVREWREYRYPLIIEVLTAARDSFATERRFAGRLSFDDLLTEAVRLVREYPGIRKSLGQRYRYLLVDEFQDTDPLQAELCFLLASSDDTVKDWLDAELRPGSLFLVGDPKQSIYRFRRADLGLYTKIHRRLADRGEVICLTQNFRSVEAIGAMVNDHFATTFPIEATEKQARFARLETNRSAVAGDGVFHYEVPTLPRGAGSAVAHEATMVASWVAAQVAAGKSPEEFLILTETKSQLELFAAEFAKRRIPAVVSGLKPAEEPEIRELNLLLSLLNDPENDLLLVAVLEGMFIGLGPQDLWEGQQHGVPRIITSAPSDKSDCALAQGLQLLHDWWRMSCRMSASRFLNYLLDETGLLAWTLTQPRGEERAAMLLNIAELAAGAENPRGNLPSLLKIISTTLAAEAEGAELRPGLGGMTRLMNLHKAKGLESDTVILAVASRGLPQPIRIHIARDSGGSAFPSPRGWLQIRSGYRVLAQPPEWDTIADEEAEFATAESDRLLYVAVTRARLRLVVATQSGTRGKGLWSRLAPSLARHSRLLVMAVSESQFVAESSTPSGDLPFRSERLRRRREALAAATFATTTVTRLVKEDPVMEWGGSTVEGDAARKLGTIVHRIMEAMGRGRSGESLRKFGDAVAAAQGLSPEELEVVWLRVEALAQSVAWQHLARGDRRQEWTVMVARKESSQIVLVEGKIDAGVLEADGWHLFDWKITGAGEVGWSERRDRYLAQVSEYREMLRDLGLEVSGGTVVESRSGGVVVAGQKSSRPPR